VRLSINHHDESVWYLLLTRNGLVVNIENPDRQPGRSIAGRLPLLGSAGVHPMRDSTNVKTVLNHFGQLGGAGGRGSLAVSRSAKSPRKPIEKDGNEISYFLPENRWEAATRQGLLRVLF